VIHRLNTNERDFFSMVNNFMNTNPFSDGWIENELDIAGIFPGATKVERAHKTEKKIKDHLYLLKKEDRWDFNRFEGDDRLLVRNVCLFTVFNTFRKRFDRLIKSQLKAGLKSIRVDFSQEAIGLFQDFGFTHDEAKRYFALCYQFRRAFYFINRSLVGRSRCMKELRLNLWNNVFTQDLNVYDQYLWNRMEDFSTLILGETGTGKGTAAMAIGRSGFIPFDEQKNRFVESFMQSFISLNLSGFSQSLIESELFGHKKGAFTGAVDDYQGVFSICSQYGAVLLDEIGELSTQIQIKLLQVLQDRIFYPVGSHREGRFRGRVIAATNRPIEDIQDSRIFRDDFYYRLCSDIILVPSLAQRISEDSSELDDLLEFTLNKMVGDVSPDLVLMVRTILDRELGSGYPWPGNVRELEQSVRRVLMKKSYAGRVTVRNQDEMAELTDRMKQGEADVQSIISGYCKHIYKMTGTYEKTAGIVKLDRRTVKKYIDS